MSDKDLHPRPPRGDDTIEHMRRIGVRIVLLAGLVASEACTIWVGRHNPSLFLNNLFVVWVASPYLGIWRLSCWARPILDWLLLALVAGSLAVYAWTVFMHPAIRPAFPFLVAPAAMWLLLGAMWISERSR